jgi:integrase/recombinase XerD
MTPLRQRMLEDMQIRNLSRSHASRVRRPGRPLRAALRPVAGRLGRGDSRLPAVLDPRAQLAPQVDHRGRGGPAVPVHGHARPRLGPADVMPLPKRPQTLPVVLSPDEVVHFLDCVSLPKHRTILTTCYAAGLRVSEAVRLTVPAIDSQRMVLRVEQGKGRRTATSCCPRLLEILRDWWRREPPRPTGSFPADRPDVPITKKPSSAPATPSTQQILQTHHPAQPAPRVRRPSPRSRHRRAHDSVAARPSQSRHDGALSAIATTQVCATTSPLDLLPRAPTAPRPVAH